MKNLNMQELAFLGDAVHTKFVREFVLEHHNLKINELNRFASKFCSAKWQSSVYEKIKDDLSEDEFNILRMARNSKPKHMAKNADPEQYHKATAFEALIGWLYVNKKDERLNEILKISIEE